MSNLLFKSQLQEYAQKACVSAPVYETTKEGPPHMPNFKASVIVNGVRYDCPEGFHNRKTAEHAAAQVALEELRKGTNGVKIVTNPVYETGLCKNLLQEYAQKLSLPVPSYSSSKIGEGNAATFTAVVEIAGISYQGGPGNSKKGAEIKAARTALSAIHAQQAFQAFSANTTITHSDVFAGTWNSQPEVHAGMKRECAFDQPSARRKAKKNKRPKSFKKKKGIIQGSTDKDGILGESSSKATENGQEAEAAAIAANVDDQHKNLQEDTSMDEGRHTKLEEAPCSQETGKTTEIPNQSVEDVAASAVGEPQNKGGDIPSNPVGNDEKRKQETNEDTDKYSVDKKAQNEHETTNHVVPDAPERCEHDKHESNQMLQEPPEKEDLKEHETPENSNEREVSLPLETYHWAV